MNIITLQPGLIENNASIRRLSASSQSGSLLATKPDIASRLPLLDGTICCGYNKVTAHTIPGTSTKTSLNFEFVVPSVSSSTFNLYRKKIQQILNSTNREQKIARSSGIMQFPPPKPASCMANYILQLFTVLMFDNQYIADMNRTFGTKNNCRSSECKKMLIAMRSLSVTTMKFSGTLTADSEFPTASEVNAFFPITSIQFIDGLTIPFTGYSNEIFVENDSSKPLTVKESYWSEIAEEKLASDI